MAVKKNSLRGRLARGMSAMALSLAGGGATGGYESGRRSRRAIQSWRPEGTSADAAILPDLPDLRARSRDLVRNSPLVAGALRTKTNGVIGTGLKFKSELNAERLGLDAEAARDLEDLIESEFALWAEQADFTGVRHFNLLQRLIYRSMRENGDIGIARRYRRDAGNPYGTKLVLIESDRISNPNRKPDTSKVRGGVELAADGAVRGYHVSDRHPGDGLGHALKWSFVPRVAPSGLTQFLLPFEQLRVGQMRGVPEMAPLIASLQQLTKYNEAEIASALNSAMLFAFETIGATDQAAGVETLINAPDTGSNSAGDDELQIEDLAIISLSEGSNVTVNSPSRPNPQYGAFVDAVLKHLGAALQLPFELLVMHFSASYSASRAALELAWKAFVAERTELVHSGFDPVLEWFFVEAVSLGRIPEHGFFDDPALRKALMGHQWVAPTRIQIDPVKEAKADQIDVGEGFKTIDQVQTERTGGDFDSKHRQRAAEHEKRREAGLTNQPSADAGVPRAPADPDDDSED